MVEPGPIESNGGVRGNSCKKEATRGTGSAATFARLVGRGLVERAAPAVYRIRVLVKQATSNSGQRGCSWILGGRLRSASTIRAWWSFRIPQQRQCMKSGICGPTCTNSRHPSAARPGVQMYASSWTDR